MDRINHASTMDGKKGWKVFADIPEPAFGITAAVLGNKIHVIGGAESNAHRVYEPSSDSWSLKSALPGPKGRGWGMSAVCEGKIHFFGGGHGKHWLGIPNAYVYDRAMDEWSNLSDMPIQRLNGAAVTAGGYIYIFGGHKGELIGRRSGEEETKITYKYDPSNDTYTRVADMPETGCFIVSAYYKGYIYAIPGCEHEIFRLRVMIRVNTFGARVFSDMM